MEEMSCILMWLWAQVITSRSAAVGRPVWDGGRAVRAVVVSHAEFCGAGGIDDGEVDRAVEMHRDRLKDKVDQIT